MPSRKHKAVCADPNHQSSTVYTHNSQNEHEFPEVFEDVSTSCIESRACSPYIIFSILKHRWEGQRSQGIKVQVA